MRSLSLKVDYHQITITLYIISITTNSNDNNLRSPVV
jgi:hypothetical protein